MKRQWLYKKNVEPTIFTGEEAISEALESGWKDTPAGFDKSKDFIVAEIVEEKSASTTEARVVKKKSMATIEAKVVKEKKPTKKEVIIEEDE